MVLKIKNLFGIITIFLLLQNYTYAEQYYSVIIQNFEQFDSYTFEFDVVIQSIDVEFSLTSYQASFSFDKSFLPDSSRLTFSYIPNSSQLHNIPQMCLEILNTDDGTAGILIFASLPGTDTITVASKRIGRFSISCSKSFSGKSLNVTWNLSGTFSTIFTGEGFSNITDYGFFSSIDEPTGVNDNEQILNYSLEQNYPNPFNPSTTIVFEIPEEAIVEIKVFNILGEEVLSLINQSYLPGSHTIDFNAASLASGLYIYNLVADNKIIESRKMLLLK